jgi:NADPH-dependent glutamate synthase beta subunit-like oxidoreductase/NAD(P)H-flavin reductase
MQLQGDYTLNDLYQRDGLVRLDGEFMHALAESDEALSRALVAARTNPDALDAKTESELLLKIAPHTEDFIARLFCIEAEVRALAERHHALAPLYVCKRQFVQRRVAKSAKPDAILTSGGIDADFNAQNKDAVIAWELAFSTQVMSWLDKPEHGEKLAAAEQYAAWALFHTEGKQQHHLGRLFKMPKKVNAEHLIETAQYDYLGAQVKKYHGENLRMRKGFSLTDAGGTLAEALDEAHYCIFCAHQSKDSCSKGLREKDGSYKVNEQKVTLAGCPLEEKISEMNELKTHGVPIGALAVVCVDNPMVAGTGHRICNDCMKACIYQKQEPVNIPLAETESLSDVLVLPYGFEIYSLLTRWNPLNIRRPYPKSPTGKKILIAGLGPAGYTLAHHLMNDGHTVVGIDGLKIEPLAPEISGVDANGARQPCAAIADVTTLYQDLNVRIGQGFGGVAEYGITVRWNKNYLTLIRLLLERRNEFRMFGGVRFGSSLTVENSFALGFDHIALCLGAGKPTLLDIPNGLARGVRTASDFLMALQLTGAARADSIANLQIRLPVVVVGGGLTAIDTATEALAYYPVQVEKFLHRYETLLAQGNDVYANYSEEEKIIADEFISHAKLFRKEKALAAKEQRTPQYAKLIHAFGGVHVAYRKRLQDAPSYRLNHEEIEKAFEEGIGFVEYLTPKEVIVDAFGHANALRCESAPPDSAKSDIILPAKTILIAAGTQPNTVLAREDAEHFTLDGKYFQALDVNGTPVTPERIAKPSIPQMLTHMREDGRAVSFFGDLHPSFAGNVVKAMGSAKQGYPVISKLLRNYSSQIKLGDAEFLSRIHELLSARVHAVNRLTSTIVEVVVHAPLAAQRFEPGQFYRLQNFETPIPTTNHQPPAPNLAMEGLAMTGAWVDKEAGLLSVIILEMGGSSNLCADLKVGEPIVLMGPTGAPTEIMGGETVLLVGGGLGNAVLFSIGKAFRAAGSKVLYFAGYKKLQDRYKTEEIEAAADVVVWCSDEAPGFTPSRVGDVSFTGNIVQAMVTYAKGELCAQTLKLSDVDRIIAIGSDKMMAAVASARHGVLKPYLKPTHVAIGSINSPMQCMMKEICAQCLQKHIDPETGAESYVYSCANQDQCLDAVSFPHLAERLKQNSVQEKLTAKWIEFVRRSK